MKIVQTRIYASLETALMLAGQQHVELMQFAQAQITEQIANAYRVLGENHLLHVQNVRSYQYLISVYRATLILEKKCMLACFIFQYHHQLSQVWTWVAQLMMSALTILHVKIDNV